MDERVTLRCHWAVLVGPSGFNRATVEQWGKVGGLGWSAALIRPLVDRYADALRVLDSNTETSPPIVSTTLAPTAPSSKPPSSRSEHSPASTTPQERTSDEGPRLDDRGRDG